MGIGYDEVATNVNYTRSLGGRVMLVKGKGKRSVATGKKLKAEGVKPGVPDLYIPAWNLWIEMKRVKGGRVSPEQKDWHEYLEFIGDTVIVGKGAEDASRKVLEFLKSNSGRE